VIAIYIVIALVAVIMGVSMSVRTVFVTIGAVSMTIRAVFTIIGIIIGLWVVIGLTMSYLKGEITL